MSRFWFLLILLISFIVCLLSADESIAIFNFGFSKGISQLDTHSNLLDAKSIECKSCHKEIYLDWNRSRHRSSWTNTVFQEGYRNETQSICKNCHSPIQELSKEGINCAVCHIRENKIITANNLKANSHHEFIYSSQISKSEFCASCHEFNFHYIEQGQTEFSNEPMQRTYSEWKEFVDDTKSNETCQSCHMKNKSHDFAGAHDSNQLTNSIQIQVNYKDGNYLFQIQSLGVGHELPTGDLFRNITLEIKKDSEDEFKSIYKFGRTFKSIYNQTKNRMEKVLDVNTNLKPKKIQSISLKYNGNIRYRLVYHYASEQDELRGNLSNRDLYYNIVEREYSIR
ncbi:MAG: cytochrome c3 family protein [Leptospiraceae bacterium]|nr:cytochrome c3 family protein [Leptospiraceae bacterium]